LKNIFKWLGYTLLTLFVLIIIAIVFISTSSRLVEFGADTFAPKYGFSYNRVSGSLLSGVEVEKLRFKDRDILEEFNFSWNPATLLYNRLSITDIKIIGADIDNIKYTAESFTSSDSPNTKQEKEKSEFKIPISIGLDNIHIDIKPFIENDITIENLSLDTDGILYDGSISINSFKLIADTNITDIKVIGNLYDRKVEVVNLSIKDINSVAIENIIKANNNSNQKEETTTTEDNKFIPNKIGIKLVDINILSREYKNILLSSASLISQDIEVDLLDETIQIANINLDTDTNISNISLKASLKDNNILVDKLSLKDIDVLTLLALAEDNNSSKKDKEEEVNTNTAEASNFIPKRLNINSLEINTKSFEYNPVKVNSTQIDGKDILVDITNKIINRGDLNISVDTNLSTLNYNATIIDNKIDSQGVVTPLQSLFETYKIPLRDNSLSPIKINLNGDKDKIDADIYLVGDRLLDVNSSEFNIENLNIINRIEYNIKDSTLKMISEANLSTPYAKSIYINNRVTLNNGVINYKGFIQPNKLEGLDKNITALIQDLNLSYSGDKSSIKAFIDSSYIKGKFISDDFKKGDFNLSTKKSIKFQEAIIGFNISAPIDFNQTMPLTIKADINSNIVNMQSKIIYDNEINIESKIDLKNNFNLKGISPLRVSASIDEVIKAKISSKSLNADVKLNQKSKDIDGVIVLSSEKFKFNGNIDKKITLDKSIPSIKKFIKNMQKIYKFETPKISGDVKLRLSLENKKDLKLDLSSNRLKLKVDRKTEHRVDDTKLSLGFVDGDLTLNSYQTTFQKQKIFATKPSLINIKESLIKISPLWINDEIKVTGIYDLKDKKGDIVAYANPFSISHKMINLKSIIDVKTKLNKDNIKIRGDVTILGGRVYFDTDKKTFASDRDIIIVQNIKPKKDKKNSNIDLLLNLSTKKPLVYKTSSADIKVNPNLVINQSYGSPLQVLGSVEIKNGSYYKFQNKKFTTKNSIIIFSGNPQNPILDISAIYNSINYQITIHITGDPTTPNIMFSSVPELTREQILSVILFDNQDAGDSSSGDDMMKMMGGAIAKSALAGVGVKIDHLSLGSDGSMEIGKKISDKVTIIYVNDEVSSARLEYDWSKDIKSSISSDGESSGVDIVFKREY